jgi:formylmethanofuran:tetrahydromethanopterin formyltransferase
MSEVIEVKLPNEVTETMYEEVIEELGEDRVHEALEANVDATLTELYQNRRQLAEEGSDGDV